ncbi:MAG: tetratricopeptide repeat protein [Campylobacteraceae bacterium]
MKKILFLLTMFFVFLSANDLKTFEAGCEKNGAKACNEAALLLMENQDADYIKVYNLFEKSCNLGYANGCFNAGLLYDKGLGVEKSLDKALSFYEAACEDGNTKACEFVGDIYFSEKQNYTKASIFYENACNGKEFKSCNNLANMYFYAEGVKEDLAKTKVLYEKACDGKYFQACNNLALLYKNANGVEENKKLALELFEKACDKNVGESCLNAGVMYVNAEGTNQNDIKAKQYFEKSCKLDNKNGCEYLEKLK